MQVIVLHPRQQTKAWCVSLSPSVAFIQSHQMLPANLLAIDLNVLEMFKVKPWIINRVDRARRVVKLVLLEHELWTTMHTL